MRLFSLWKNWRPVKALSLGVGGVALGLLLSGGAAAACQKIRVVGSDQWVPFAYADVVVPDHPLGIAYDVVRLISRDLGIPVEIEMGLPWLRIELELDTGAADLLAGNYWNDERAMRWAITEPIATDEVRVFTLSDKTFQYQEIADLIGKSGVMPFGISYGQEFDTFKSNLDLDEVRLHTQAISMLALERRDYMILPLYSGKLKVNRMGYKNQIVALPEPLAINNVHLALSRKSPCIVLLELINQAILKRKQDGSIDEIVRRYQ